ncbi:MAG: stage III sporulation protein AA [Lachnospiraceae bacterium]|jgi:stage III sporulation protein AA|nr:stage III sporulation protein AA [Lachnospiraceae bacterium]MCI9390284.1 stage III sporulation protein AA [Lachnospiraceae bacterium]MCI9470052.1 stage III sporulation protein AA [Lachnospiraceae bacterium]
MDESQIIRLFSGGIRRRLEKAHLDQEQLCEIRLRVHNPCMVLYRGEESFLDKNGGLTRERLCAYCVTGEDIKETMEHIAGYSLYAYEEEIRQGYLTVQGGHRVGIAGKAVMEGEHIRSVKYISYINVRISHQVKGCASPLMPYVRMDRSIYHTLIISPPLCGKTTMLRDMIRQISDGDDRHPGLTVGVVDERSEIGGCYQGVAQNDLGIRTDVLDCCPKAEGMMMLIRSMSPAVVAVDEIGDYRDIHAIEAVIHCGCKLMATVHGDSIEDLRQKPLFARLMDEHIFERYILLQGRRRAGEVRAIFDQRGTCLYQEGRGG